MLHKSIIEKDVIKDVYLYNLKSSKSPLLNECYEESDLWTLLYASVKDEILIKVLLFNLEFNISPVHTFIKYYNDELSNRQLTRFHKQCIGYHIAFLLASLGYKKTRQIYRKDAIIKYGAFYEKIAPQLQVIDNGSNHGNSGNISKI